MAPVETGWGTYGGTLGSLLVVVQLSAVSAQGIVATVLYAALGATVGFLTQILLRKLVRWFKINID
ncbi:hypothetical protein [Hymenobacter sp. B81]|uniref:hypothetical protein n=1 Tax=Hymenobacter sp. B81 TaxID=3344878 RepID=UPI0037DCDDF8